VNICVQKILLYLADGTVNSLVTFEGRRANFHTMRNSIILRRGIQDFRPRLYTITPNIEQ